MSSLPSRYVSAGLLTEYVYEQRIASTPVGSSLDSVNSTQLYLGLGLDDNQAAVSFDLAELVMYDRALSHAELIDVWGYFTREYAPERPPPELELLTPGDGATVYGTEVFVSWQTVGDTTQADHVHISLDAGEVTMVWNLNSNYTYVDMQPGVYQLEVALYTSNHSPLENDRSAVIINFVVEAASTSPVRSRREDVLRHPTLLVISSLTFALCL